MMRMIKKSTYESYLIKILKYVFCLYFKTYENMVKYIHTFYMNCMGRRRVSITAYNILSLKKEDLYKVNLMKMIYLRYIRCYSDDIINRYYVQDTKYADNRINTIMKEKDPNIIIVMRYVNYNILIRTTPLTEFNNNINIDDIEKPVLYAGNSNIHMTRFFNRTINIRNFTPKEIIGLFLIDCIYTKKYDKLLNYTKSIYTHGLNMVVLTNIAEMKIFS